MLSLPAGAWAAHMADDGSGQILAIGAVTMAFAVFAALALANGFRFLYAMIALALHAPKLLRQLTAAPPAPQKSPDPRDVRRDWWAHLGATLIHALTLLAAALLIAALIAMFTATPFAALWWRFALAAGVLSLLTWHGLRATLP